MKELNKLIEGIAFPVRYDDETGDILDSDGQWVCTVHCGLEVDGNLIAHALNNLHVDISEKSGHEKGMCRLNKDEMDMAIDRCNNLDATHHPAEVSAGHQPKEEELGRTEMVETENGPQLMKYTTSAEPVSGERTGEEGERLLFDVISSIEQFGEVPDDLMRRAKEAVKYE